MTIAPPTPLPQRRIGPFAVSSIGLGCMNLSHAYDVAPTEEEGARLLNEALDRGCTLLDTAAIYGTGANERLLGRAVMHRRREFVLASKCVLDLVDGKRVLDGRPEAIRRSCEAALARLRTDVIDLYYLHRLDRDVPIEDSVGALAELVAEGKIRTIGLSEMSAATIERAHAVHPIAAVQSEYSLVVRNPEVAVLAACERLGIAFVAFSPLARGLLAGGIASGTEFVPNDIRRTMPRFVGPALEANLQRIGTLASIAGRAGCTIGQFALAWLLARSPAIVAIPGTRSIGHLAANLAAATLEPDPALLAEADALLPPNALHGARYAAAAQAQIETELLPGEELA